MKNLIKLSGLVLLTGAIACEPGTEMTAPELAPNETAAATAQAQGGLLTVEMASVDRFQNVEFMLHLDAERGLISAHMPSDVCFGGTLARSTSRWSTRPPISSSASSRRRAKRCPSPCTRPTRSRTWESTESSIPPTSMTSSRATWPSSARFFSDRSASPRVRSGGCRICRTRVSPSGGRAHGGGYAVTLRSGERLRASRTYADDLLRLVP